MEPEQSAPRVKSIYSNSFEFPSDTGGWAGYGDWSFHQSAPPGGGKQSFQVWGTDISPQAERVLPALQSEGEIILKFSARCLTPGGGSVRLVAYKYDPVNGYPGIAAGFSDTLWHEYADTGFLPRGHDLHLQIDGNGWMATKVLIDHIEIFQTTLSGR